jgi:macrodomain Ter protein organizer (MatP/YcbG family)
MSKEQIRRVARKVIESKGVKSVARIMVEEGYPETTAHNPQQVTNSKTYKEIFEKYITDDDLASKHKSFLNSENEMVGIKALDMGYKVKGNYAAEKKDININTLSELFNSTLDETNEE